MSMGRWTPAPTPVSRYARSFAAPSSPWYGDFIMGRALRPLAVSLALAGAALAGSPVPARAISEPDRLWLVGERAFQDGLASLSRKSLERLIERFPSDARVPEATLLLGKACLAAGDLPAALDAFRRAATMSPPPGKPDEPRFWEAEALFRMKRYLEARPLFDLVTADTASPFAPDALYGLAWSELELKRYDAAMRALTRLVETAPGHASAPAARVQLARTAMTLKKYDDAAAAVSGFAEKYPDHRLLPEAQYLLGYARTAAGKPEGISDLRAFLAKYPGHELAPQARRLIVDTLARSGRKAELAEEYKTLMATSPPTAEAFYDAGTIATLLGRSREAEAAWKALRSGFSDHPLARRAALEQAQVAFERGVFKDAAALARSAAASPEVGVRARAFLLLGETEVKLKRFAPAHEAFRDAVQAAGADDAIRYRALAGSGLALEEQQRWAEAARYYQQVADGSDDKDLRAWARTRRAAVEARRDPASKSAPPVRPSTRPGAKEPQPAR
jgi:TolA-binding protein